ncbi:hypothetical protein PC120_g26717, partial [Phytophthora cactorum]
MLFSGGLVPSYIVVTQVLHLRDSIWALILPSIMNAFYIIVMRTFFTTTVPDAVIESAKIDGATEFGIYTRIVLPISLPGIATIGLFSTLGFWNDWFNALLYIDNAKLIPLQTLLIRIQNNMDFVVQNSSRVVSYDIASTLPTETVRMAMVVLATLPVALAYPFFQKYFIQGLTIGCGGSNTNDTSGNAASGGESGDKDTVKLKVYLIGGPQRDLPMVQEEMNKYLMEKINTTVDITMIDWGDYSKRMPVITASGENYDIAFTSSWAYDYLPNATRGAFLPINDLLDKYGQGIKEQLDPRFLTGSQIGGQNYAVPVNKELASQWVWRFNKQYVDKYNMDITKIRTLEDLEPYLQQIKDNEPADITPLAVPKGFKPYLAFDFLLGDEFPVGINMHGDTRKYVNVL